jgi:integrase
MFNLAIDSKLRGCDVVALKVDDVAPNGYTVERATVRQRKTGRPVKFELTEQTRQAIEDYLRASGKKPGEFLFTSHRQGSHCMTTRQYARLVADWIGSIGLDPRLFGTHSLRRTKATLIYRRSGNLRAVQLLLETATYCPRTPDRRTDLLSVPSTVRRDRAHCQTARVPRHRAGGHSTTRQLARLHTGVDDARGGGSIRAH